MYIVYLTFTISVFVYVSLSLYFGTKKIFTNGQLFLLTDKIYLLWTSSSFAIQSMIDTELDDLILDLVYEIHSSLKGIPEDQLEINNNGPKTKTFSIPFLQSQTTAIEKQTCICPHCGQSNIVGHTICLSSSEMSR